MAMLRKNDTAYKVAQQVLKKKGVKLPKTKSIDKMPLKGPYLLH